MAKKEISVVIRAKSFLKQGYGEIQKFGKSLMTIGKTLATGFIAAGAAVAGFVGKALSAYAEAEKAERSLAAAIDAHVLKLDIDCCEHGRLHNVVRSAAAKRRAGKC